MMVEKKDSWVEWLKKVNIFKLDASMSSAIFIYTFDLSDNHSYKMVHLNARKDVICDYYCRKLP